MIIRATFVKQMAINIITPSVKKIAFANYSSTLISHTCFARKEKCLINS